jgi:hypothetical protein
MKNYFFVGLLLSLTSNLFSQITQIPDPNFEQYLVDFGYDSDGVVNGQILTSDATSVYYLNLDGLGISDLTGIEDFTSLNTLVCRNNNLTSLEVLNLQSLEWLDCSNNSLTTLDVSGLRFLEFFYCRDNQLTSLIFDEDSFPCNDDLYLYCNNNQLTSLDLSHCLLLADLDCRDNQLESLFVNGPFASVLAGNNSLSEVYMFSGEFGFINSVNNPNLFCIQVSDPAYATENWTNIDPQTTFSTDCNYSENCFRTEDSDVYVGLTNDIKISLENSVDIKGFQFDITLPDGFVFNPVDITKENLPDSYELSCANVGGNTFRVIGYSLTNETITTGESTVISLPTTIDPTVEENSYEVPISNFILSDANNDDVSTGCFFSGSVTVFNRPIGDANGDTFVNVLDILATIDHIFGNTPTPFFDELVDINSDETINVLDILEIQDIILGTTSSFNENELASRQLAMENFLFVNDAMFSTDSWEVMEINLNNDDNVKGLQFDFSLPEGFTFNIDDITETSRIQGFTVTVQEISPRTYRVLAFSLSGGIISSGVGDILELSIYIEPDTVNETYPIELANVIISDENNVDVSTTPSAIGQIIISTLGLQDLTDNLENQVKVFPVPVENILSIKSAISGTYLIYDINGKRIGSGKVDAGRSSIDMSKCESGIYIFQFNDGTQSTRKRIIKH